MHRHVNVKHYVRVYVNKLSVYFLIVSPKMAYLSPKHIGECNICVDKGAVLRSYAASSGNLLPRFRNNLSVPFSETSLTNYTTRRVITQKSAVLSYFVAEA
jgi:hypothetical protein